MSPVSANLLIISGSSVLAVAFVKLRKRSVRLFWGIFLAFMIPAAVFTLYRLISGADPNSTIGQMVSTFWGMSVIGALFSSLSRFTNRPVLLVLLGLLLYVLGILIVITVGVNIGLMEP
jgi:hypothetical protein